MKRTITTVFTLCCVISLAFAQVDKATGTVPNDTTQARLRVNNCVFNGPNLDIFVDGVVAENGGVPQTDQGFWTGGYLFLEPGTHSVAVAPAGGGIERALVGPLDVSLSAGHRYTLVVMGQAGEASYEALVIDETAAYQALGATPRDTPHITVNNVRGAAGVTFELDGVAREEDVPYGEFRAALWPTGTFSGLDLTLRDDEREVLIGDGTTDELWNAPGDWLDCVGGTPGAVGEAWFNRTSPSNSTLPALEFLEALGSIEGAPYTFHTFLDAVRTAGLSDVLTAGGPHFMLVPTDEAFAALPDDQLNALLADPEALADVLRYHIAEGYYPLGATGFGQAGRTLVNLLGVDLFLDPGGDSVNGVDVGEPGRFDTYFVANGTRVRPSAAVLLPPSQ